MTSKLTVRHRIFAGFTVVLLVLGVELGVALSGLHRIEEIRGELAAVIEPRAQAADELERSVLYRAIAVRNYVTSADRGHLERYDKALGDAEKARRRLASLALDDESRARFERIALSSARHVEATGSFLRLVDSGARGDELTATESRLSAAREDLLSEIHAFTQLQDRQRATVGAAAAAARQEVRWSLLGCAVLVALALAATAVLTTRAVRMPALRLVAAARDLAQGHAAPALALAAGDDGQGGVAAGDELGELGVAFGRMACALKRREERLAADGRIAAAIARSLEVEEVSRAALAEVVEFTRAEIAAVYVLGDGAEWLVRVADHNLGQSPVRVPAGEGVLGEALRSGQAAAVRGIPRSSAFTLRLGFDEAPPEEVLAVPFSFGATRLGVVVLGSLRPFAADARPFAERVAEGLAVSVQNALAHRRARLLAEDLQRSNEQLQAQNEELQAQGLELQAQSEELREHQEALAEKAGALETVDRRKNEFLATLGHELRNPLAAIASAAQLLEARGGDRASRHAAVISRQARQLGRLVDDLLDVARIEHGKVELRLSEVDLRDVVRNAVDASRPALSAKRHRVSAVLPERALRVRGDATRLEQVMSNLLHNAAKYTPEEGSVAIRAELEGGSAVVRVRDDGIGMTPELISRVFDAFTQGEPSSGAQQGLGLGLALVRRLVAMHGGSVEARSAGPGEGSEFVVRLPALPAARAGDRPERPPAGARAPAAPDPRGGLRILVVDDNPDVAETLGELLAFFGHEVRIESDAESGLRACLELLPDVALLDLGMPGMDGFELARRIRRGLPAGAATRLVAVTGHGTAEDRARSRRAGFDLHVVKPVGADELRELLDGFARDAHAAAGGAGAAA